MQNAGKNFGVIMIVGFISIVGIISAVLIIINVMTSPIPVVPKIDTATLSYTTKDLNCDVFKEGELITDYASLQVTYPEEIIINPSIEEDNCNLDFNYLGASLIVNIAPEEKQIFNFNKNLIAIDRDNNIYRPTFDLENAKFDQEYNQYYFQYGQLLEDQSICDSAENYLEDITSPCGEALELDGLELDVITTIPEDKTDIEIENILSVFDEIVGSLNGRINENMPDTDVEKELEKLDLNTDSDELSLPDFELGEDGCNDIFDRCILIDNLNNKKFDLRKLKEFQGGNIMYSSKFSKYIDEGVIYVTVMGGDEGFMNLAVFKYDYTKASSVDLVGDWKLSVPYDAVYRMGIVNTPECDFDKYPDAMYDMACYEEPKNTQAELTKMKTDSAKYVEADEKYVSEEYSTQLNIEE